MEAIEASGGEKARHCIGATFDQHATHAAGSERGENSRRRDFPVHFRQSENFNAGRRRTRPALRGDQQSPDAVISKDPGVGAKPALWIDNHACRLRPGDLPHRQLRVVGDRSPDPHDDGVHQGPKPVQMDEARRTVDVFRMTRLGGDSAVERLTYLPDNHKIVDGALPQRTENICPALRKWLLPSTKYIRKVFPSVGRLRFA